MNDVLFFNGRWTTTDERVLGVEDRGFQFGDAVYEVFKFLRKRPILAIDHFRRLDRGLREIDIRNPWNESGFLRTVDELLDRTIFDDGIVYIQVSRGEGERAHFYPDNMPPTALMYTRRFKFPDEVKKEIGIRLITAPDLRWKQCQVKSVNLLPNALAKKRAQRKGADEALLVGEILAKLEPCVRRQPRPLACNPETEAACDPTPPPKFRRPGTTPLEPASATPPADRCARPW